MKFSAIQQKTIDSRGKNVVVSASAGSGKTSVLVERLCQLVIQDRISIDSILAMTFTEDAASEMKARLKKKLSELPKDEYVQNQLALLETADISTIDSFCYKLVQTYYYQIPISYSMSQHVENGPLRLQAFEQAYQRACDELDTSAYANLKLYFLAFGNDEERIQKSLQNFLNIANAKPHPQEWMEQAKTMHSDVPFWFFQYFKERLVAMISMCKQVLSGLDENQFKKIKDYENYHELFSSKIVWLTACLKNVKEQDYESFSTGFKQYLQATKRFPKTINKVDYSQIGEEFKDFEQQITDCLFSVKTWKTDQVQIRPILDTFVTLAINTQKYFQEEKKKAQILDFSDMEHFAFELLQNPIIQEEVRNHFEMILVDEFQDTNDLQESIIHHVQRGNNVFRVGDIKQSIYGFRQAKPDIMKGHMIKDDDLNETLFMYENYRSDESIIQFTNQFFHKIMNTDLLGSQFSDFDKAQAGTSQQKELPQKPVRFLFTQYEEWAANQDEKVNKLQAKKMHRAHRVDLIAHDILKHHKMGTPYRSMCILTRTHSVHEELKAGLEAYGIPVLAEIDHGFYANQAIQIMVSTLKSLVNPDDDIALTAMLCSPMVKVNQMQLSKACVHRNLDTSLFEHLKNFDFMKSFYEIYEQRSLQIPELIQYLYNYHEFYYNYTSGQDKTNLDLLLEMASVYPNPRDLKGFIHQIEQEAHLDKTSEAFPYGKEEDVVKIKTMHHSKGLQFPIVYILSKSSTTHLDAINPILFDEQMGIAMQGLSKSHQLKRMSPLSIAFRTKKFHDELQEEMRIFYVAVTRAEKELIIVDSIKSLDMYRYPFNERAILQNRSYTSWLLHTYLTNPSAYFVLDEKKELYERPMPVYPKGKMEIFKVYNQASEQIESQTASASKNENHWKPIDFTVNTSVQRGTLFHEIVAQCPFPYQAQDIQKFAKDRGFTLLKKDIVQILALNENLMYFDWMNHKHEFECSYVVSQAHQIVHGFMDLVVWYDKEIVILDFKTDFVYQKSELIDRYTSQLNIYRAAIQKIYPDKKVKAYIYSFYLNKMCEIYG